MPIVQRTHGRRLADTLKDETICNIQDKELLDVSNCRYNTCKPLDQFCRVKLRASRTW
jgi:hypothetical protein